MSRTKPNILITGTPGTGKTSLSAALASATGMRHVEVSALVKEKSLHEGKDKNFDSYIVDEDKLCDELEDLLKGGNSIVDFHSCDFFPERWFDLVVVLRTDNSTLYPRLESRWFAHKLEVNANRGYSQKKITENIECEIMQVLLDEARDSYKQEIILELPSNNIAEMDNNLEKLSKWINEWK